MTSSENSSKASSFGKRVVKKIKAEKIKLDDNKGKEKFDQVIKRSLKQK